jgi:hypothetical protein
MGIGHRRLKVSPTILAEARLKREHPELPGADRELYGGGGREQTLREPASFAAVFEVVPAKMA